jgi:hypothetical protein
MKTITALSLLLGLTVGLSACGSTGAADVESPRSSFAASGLITHEEIREAQILSDAYEIVRRLRPAWLRQRRTTSLHRHAPDPIPVYVDGVIQYGPTENALRAISAAQVRSIDRLTARQAQNRLGMNHPAGAFLVDLY